MHREHQAAGRSDSRDQLLDQGAERFAPIHIRRPMQRHDRVLPRCQAQRRGVSSLLDLRAAAFRSESIMMLPTRSMRSPARLRRSRFSSRVGRRRPQQVGDRIGDEPIDLLGHAPVAAAQARLEMHDRNPQLRADHRARGGRIDVADDDDPVRLARRAHTFSYAIITPPVCSAWRAAADFQVMVRLGQAQVPEERVRHVGVVVLAGMHDRRLAPGFGGKRVVERRDLHEVRARRGDQVDVQHFPRESGSKKGRRAYTIPVPDYVWCKAPALLAAFAPGPSSHS